MTIVLRPQVQLYCALAPPAAQAPDQTFCHFNLMMATFKLFVALPWQYQFARNQIAICNRI
jgi:hypothetical protein